MTNLKTGFEFKKLAILSLLSFTLAYPQYASAKSTKRKSSIPQHLLNKVLKKKYQKPIHKKEVSKAKKSAFAFNTAVLNSSYVSWGVDPANKESSINLLPAWKAYEKKKDIVVAVIDTGIEEDHDFLKSNIHVLEGNRSSKNYGIDFSKGKRSRSMPFDSHGHGTHVSAIIKSVNPGVKILSLKYYNPSASGQDNLSSTIAALKYAVDKNVDVINYSGGGPEPSLEELRILKEAERKGILVVAAAGNEKSNIDVRSNAYYPASYGLTNIITVTAHDKDLTILDSSNWGKTVDVAAPGHRIKSALPKGRAGYLTGTSQATAFVTGSASLIMGQYPSLSTPEIREIIKHSVNKESKLSSKCSSGGRLDAGKAQTYAAKYIKAKRTRALANKISKVKAKKLKAVNRKVAGQQGKIIFVGKIKKNKSNTSKAKK